MLNNTFTWNGHSSDEFGIYIERMPDMNRSARKFMAASVPGRNGNIYQLENAWEEVLVTYEIFAGGPDFGDVVPAFTDIMEWLNSADGYAKLTDSYDSGHYRLAVFVDATLITSKWYAHGRATITFRCRPERFIVTSPLTPTSGSTIANSTNHIAEPIITLTGSGARSMLNLGGRSAGSVAHGYYYEDSIYLQIPTMNTNYWVFRRPVSSLNPDAGGLEVRDASAAPVSTITNTNGALEFSVASDYQSQDWGIGIVQTVQGDSDYTISCEAYGGGYIQVMCAGKSGYNDLLQVFTSISSGSGWEKTNLTFHTPSECGYVVIIFTRESSHSTAIQRYRKIMLNKGTEILPFREYAASPSSQLIINDLILRIQGTFDTGEVDCERENVMIDGVNSNNASSLRDSNGNLSAEYLKLSKGNNTISFDGEIAAISIDPRFWEL